MKVKLLQDSRREGKAGEIVEVSPERFAFLTSLGTAVPVTEARERAEEPAKAVREPAVKHEKKEKAQEKKPAKAVKGSKK